MFADASAAVALRIDPHTRRAGYEAAAGLAVTGVAATAGYFLVTPLLISPLAICLVDPTLNLEKVGKNRSQGVARATWLAGNIVAGIAISALSPGFLMGSALALVGAAVGVLGAGAIAFLAGTCNPAYYCEALPKHSVDNWHYIGLLLCLQSISTPSGWLIGLLAGVSMSVSLKHLYDAGRFKNHLSAQQLGICICNNIVNAFIAGTAIVPRGV